MSSAVGALFTIAGANFAGTGLRIDNAVGPPAFFGLACDLWEDFSTNATVASGLLTSITERSTNAAVLTGSIPYTPDAVGSLGGVSNNYGASPASGFLSTAAGAKSVYDWNKPFSVSLAFIYGGCASGAGQSIVVGAFAPSSEVGCGWALMPGANAAAFGAGKINILMDSFAGEPSGILVHGTLALTVGTLYRVHMTYDGSGTAAGLNLYINGAQDTLVVYSSPALTSTWISSSSPQGFGNFSATAADSMYGTLLEVFTVSRVYTSSDLTTADGWLSARYS